MLPGCWARHAGYEHFTRAKIIKIKSELQKIEKNILAKNGILLKKFIMF